MYARSPDFSLLFLYATLCLPLSQAQDRREREQLMEAMTAMMSKLESMKGERDKARGERDEWKRKYHQLVAEREQRDQSATSPRPGAEASSPPGGNVFTQRREAMLTAQNRGRSLRDLHKDTSAASLGANSNTSSDSRTESEFEMGDAGDERLRRHKLKQRVKLLEESEKKLQSDLTLAGKRNDAIRQELRRTRAELSHELGNLRQELVETQKELTELKGETKARKVLIESAAAALRQLKPWVGLEIPPASRAPSVINLRAVSSESVGNGTMDFPPPLRSGANGGAGASTTSSTASASMESIAEVDNEAAPTPPTSVAPIARAVAEETDSSAASSPSATPSPTPSVTPPPASAPLSSSGSTGALSGLLSPRGQQEEEEEEKLESEGYVPSADDDNTPRMGIMVIGVKVCSRSLLSAPAHSLKPLASACANTLSSCTLISCLLLYDLIPLFGSFSSFFPLFSGRRPRHQGRLQEG